MSKVLSTGESAGGYLSVQSALGSSFGLIKAAIATYPVLDLKCRFYTEEYEKNVRGAPMFPKTLLAEHIQAVETDAKNGNKRVVTSATPPERMALALSIIQQGLTVKLYGDERIVYPFERIEDVDEVVPILIIHGREDTAVPVEGSERWVELARGRFGNEKVRLVVQPGEHGFDKDVGVTLETPWLKNELVHLTEAWLGKK